MSETKTTSEPGAIVTATGATEITTIAPGTTVALGYGSDSSATQATAGTASAVSGAAVVVICWLANLAHLLVPNEVAVALMVLITAGTHFLGLKYMIGPTTKS